MRNLLYFSSLIAILLTSSCSKKDDVDPRDQYVGTYSVQANLNQDYFQNGQKTGSYTEEISGGTATVDVSKLGTNQLKIGDSIDFTIYTVEGNRLTAEPESSDESYADGLREIIVTQSSGQLGAGKITGQDTFTGTWSYSGQTGTTTGVLNWTLTKR